MYVHTDFVAVNLCDVVVVAVADVGVLVANDSLWGGHSCVLCVCAMGGERGDDVRKEGRNFWQMSASGALLG